jgi:hypothetical protein
MVSQEDIIAVVVMADGPITTDTIIERLPPNLKNKRCKQSLRNEVNIRCRALERWGRLVLTKEENRVRWWDLLQ